MPKQFKFFLLEHNANIIVKLCSSEVIDVLLKKASGSFLDHSKEAVKRKIRELYA